MIETDEKGQRMWLAVLAAINTFEWNDWEMNFIRSLKGNTYAQLRGKQKSVVGELYEKLVGR